MSLLDEQLVDEWLNRKNFFTIRGIKCGVDEIDLLAIRENADQTERWHVEVQVSFRPIGYIGGDTNARKRTAEEIRAGVEQWVAKKFTSARKVARRNEIAPKKTWRHIFVHGVVRNEIELTHMQELGVELIPYRQILTDLMITGSGHSSSTASSILEIIGYAKRFNILE